MFLIRARAMMFNATFNKISVISWRSVLLVEKTTDLSQGTDKLYHIMLQTYRNMLDRQTRQVKIKPVRRCFQHISPKVW